uniref:CASC1 C-terminal domain-containing protein n=1 Tax=Glossina pallidipes TaxID=7398 RepID=A0A1A9ZL85_GLOPL
MANDKKKKAEQTKPAPQKQYDILTVEKVKANESKYTQRLMELRACLILIDDAIKDEIKKNDLQLLLEKWVAYITCDPLPKAYVPPNIRTFYAKAQAFEQALLDRNIDWNLNVDERSILTQNVFREDRTRPTLMRAASNELIVSYDKYIDDSLQILHKIEYYLANDKETMKAKSEVLLDIIEVKEAIQKEITDVFDRLTYKILCTEQANMTSLDAVSTEYTYKCDNFAIHIWGLKNVPIRFTHLAEPRMVAHLRNLNIVLHIPISVLRPQLTIQGIHMNFDHITEYARNAKQEFFIPLAHLNAGIQDLPECLANEFQMQLDIQKRVRNQIMETYKEYMEKLAQLKESQEALLKQRKTPENKRKPPKPMKPLREPQFLRDDEYPEIFYEFLDEEGKQYNSFINVVYNPANLNLSSDEINLKKFFILGGIFHLNFVERPTHYDLKDFNMTWHTPNKQLLRDNDFVISPLRPISIKRSSMIIRLNEPKPSLRPEVEALKDEVEAANPWFVLTFSLPECLCSWGEPIACHYTSVEAIAEVEQEDQTIQAQVDTLLNIGEIAVESEFSMDTIGDRVKAAKRMSIRHSDTNFFSTSPAHMRASLAEQYSIERTDGIFHKKDFALNNAYTVRQLRYLEQDCAPQILSSYKFPKEISEELNEALHNAPKGKGGILFKKAQSVVGQSKRAFTYNEMQNNPERFFPIFKKVKPVYITNHLYSFRGSLSDEPKTFYQLVKAIILVKRLAQNAVTQIMQLPSHEPQVPPKSFKKLKMNDGEKKKKKQSLKLHSKSFQTESSQIKVQESFREPIRRKTREIGRETVKSPRSQAEVSFRESEEYTEEASSSLDTIADGGMKNTTVIRYNHWTTQHIRRQTFLREERKYVIETDRLGYIGFACKRYEHFPFKFWSLQPSAENENEVIFTLETQYVKCVLSISEEGIRGYATEPSKRFVRDPKLYLDIKEPIKDFKELRKRFRDKNLNIFADHDACFYIENGNFSEKHLAMEMHTYCCMALHCTEMIYTYSKWNGLAKRRDIILHYVHYKDNPDNTVLLHVTPEEATFVEKQRNQLTPKQSKQAVPRRSSRTGKVSRSYPINKVYKLLTSEEHKARHERQKANNLQKNILAPHYDKSIDDKLKVLRNIDKFLDDDSETTKVATEQLRTIVDMMVATEQEICDVFDRFTYRIISAENIYMKSIDPITSEFCHSCANFDIHIWSLKNVPIRFTHMHEPRLIANLRNIDLKLHIPFSALSPLMTIQGIRMNFDNISKHAKSFKQETYLPLENLNAGIYGQFKKNLRECLLNEYKMLLVIQRRVRHEIKEKYQKYKEDLLRHMESRLQTQTGLKANRVIKPFRSKEPQTCADDQYPDVINDFLEEEHNQYLGFINVMYNPQTLELDSDEINLRKFQILGGIYQLNVVKKPKQINFFQKSNMTWHCEGQNLVVENDFRVHKLSTMSPEALARFTGVERMTNISGASRKSAYIVDEPAETEEAEASNPWFVLTFYLPDYLSCWGSPMACHYESVDEDLPVEKRENSRENMIKSLIRLDDDENESSTKLSPEERQIMELQDMLRKRLHPSRSLYASSPSIARLHNMTSFSMANVHTALQAIRDFKLDSFTLSQVHNMQRFCVPMLLPSYQFPKETKEKGPCAKKQMAKSSIGALVHSHQVNNSLEEGNNLSHSYIFDHKLKNPERLFAIYDEAEPVLIVKSLPNIDYDVRAHSEPKTFYQLIKALMAMKKVIQNHVNKLMSVMPHKTDSNLQRMQSQMQKKWLTFASNHKRTLVVKPLTLKTSGSLRSLSISQSSKIENLTNVTADVKDDSSSDLSSIATTATGISTNFKDAKETKVVTYTHWTTKYIKTERFFKAERKYVIETDRLGYIGFAFKRYEHFPFKYWNLQPDEADPNNKVVLTIITQHVKCVLKVSGQGVRGYVTAYMHGQQSLANPQMHLVIDKPIKDYTELKRLFKEKNVNIFPDNDASFYVENGYFCEKHLAMELHTYSCMTVHCSQMKFTHSQWNCLAKRRDIILQAVQWKDNPDNTVLMHVTPEETTFVEVKEMCTEEREEVKLSYTSTWRNINVTVFAFEKFSISIYKSLIYA